MEDVFPIYDLLLSFVPPCERSSGVPANIVSILNTGMVFMIDGKEHFYKVLKAKNTEQELEADAKINELIMKGIELSYLEMKLRK